MSQRKHCSYKGCNSKQIPGLQSDLTFFQFPRDKNRYDLWMKLSRCENQDAPLKYICSKHFDERKYVSRNPRRLLLLASALPYEYVSGDEDVDIDNEVDTEEEQIHMAASKSDDEDFLLQSMEVSEFNEADCSYAESTINEVEYVQEVGPSKSFEFINKKRKWPARVEATTVKIIENIEQPLYESDKNEISTSKRDEHHSREAQEVEIAAKKQQLAGEEVIDNPNITTFIFKGEEYIQMPKRVYTEEKDELLASIQYYKEIILNIKAQMDDVKI